MEQILINRYLAKFDELNTSIVSVMNAENEKKAIEEFDDILIDAYIEGFASARYILGDVDMDKAKLNSSLKQSYDGVSIQDKMKEYYNTKDEMSAKNLIDSEFHRMYNTARNNAFVGFKKQWITVGDERVRTNHELLEGVTVESNERFYTIDGDSALFPGGFANAENNANCRCIVDYLI